jgi:hypothetical protein
LDWSLLAENCLRKQTIEGKVEGGIEMTGSQRRRRKQVLDLKETGSNLELKKEALALTLWRTGFGNVC